MTKPGPSHPWRKWKRMPPPADPASTDFNGVRIDTFDRQRRNNNRSAAAKVHDSKRAAENEQERRKRGY